MAPASTARPRLGLLAAVVALVVALGVAFGVTQLTSSRAKDSGSAGGPAGGGHGKNGSASVGVTTTPPIPHVVMTIPSAVKTVQAWSKPVRVKVVHGTLVSLTAVDDKGVALTGTPTKNSWVSTGTVIPSRTYQVQGTIRGLDGKLAVKTLTITTTAPDRTEHVRVNVQVGKAVGVGWPITVHFTAPVTNRAAVEKALTVQTSVPVVGAWHWFSDTEVHYRPQVYWPVHTQIVLHRNLDGIEVAPGVWGTEDKDMAFNVGDKHVTTVDVATQHMTVMVNDKFFATYAVSTGRPTLPTLGGKHIVLEKWQSIEMNSESLKPPIHKFLPNGKKNPLAYDEKELWATRISNAGAFVHYNPDTVKVQGVAAASHGCINTQLGPAEAFYNLSQLGDIVDVIHSTQGPNVSDPGMQDWNFSWDTWLKGSATGA